MTNYDKFPVYGPAHPIEQARQAAEKVIALTEAPKLLGVERSEVIYGEAGDVTLVTVPEGIDPAISVNKYPSGTYVITYNLGPQEDSRSVAIFSDPSREPHIASFDSHNGIPNDSPEGYAPVNRDMNSKEKVALARDLSQMVMDLSNVAQLA